ncbi:MAG: ParB N-terminal domain-containing protein [Chloroflexi bacterium]|nr:ParB N-terminal domain-containing protein [Chloroflexota bacterium]
MQVIDLPLSRLRPASWNSNVMDEAALQRLRSSIRQYGLVENLVVRSLSDGLYEVLSGNHRLEVLREMGCEEAPCVVVEATDGKARLLAQALNRIHGEDDLGLRAELLRSAIAELGQEAVLSLLPETEASLQGLASLGALDMASYLEQWQRAQADRLRTMVFRLTKAQIEVIERALEAVIAEKAAHCGDVRNLRGVALTWLSRRFLEERRTK